MSSLGTAYKEALTDPKLETMKRIEDRLDRIESKLDRLLEKQCALTLPPSSNKHKRS